MERIQAEYKFIKAGMGELVGFIEAGVFTVAEIYARSPGNFAVQEANAEFIVRAVNSHDQLLAALKDAIFYADSIVERGIWGEADAKRFRDVLNAATGEQS